MCQCGYSLCACSVDVSVSLCLFRCWPLHLHGSLLNRCSLTNSHSAPLFSCLSVLFSLSYILYFFPLCCVSPLLTLSVQFSFSLSWVPPPFVSFTFNNHLFHSFPFVSSLLFLPLFLSVLLKMMPLIKRMVRSSHSASPATAYSRFSFFLALLFPNFIPVHHSIPAP